MKRLLNILIVVSLVGVASCDLNETPASVSGFTNDLCFQNAMANGHIFRMDGKVWLRGSEEDSMHFDISGWSLRPCQLNLGLGREYFPALITPAFVNVADHLQDYQPDDRVILLESGTGVKIYPFNLLTRHELINDEVDGQPVMITYSLLSDHAAVYRRNYCDTTFTYAVSGYTYWDYNIQNAASSFLFWDRETESLWWPLIDKAVSGQMQGIWLVHYNESKWRVSTWQKVTDNYPDALLLEEDQTMEAPLNWPRYIEVSCK